MRISDRKNSPAVFVRLLRARLGTLVGGGMVSVILIFLIAPTLLVVAMSFADVPYIQFPPRQLSLRWYASYFGDPQWMRATAFSLEVALGTMLASTIVGTMAAVAFARGDLVGAEIIRTLAVSPMIAPSIVTAVALYLVFAPIGLTSSYLGFIVADTMLAVPYVVVMVTASLESFDVSIELAALNCGASRLRAFFEVVLPNIRPAVASAAVFAFLSSFDEVTVAIFISGSEVQTMTSKLFENIENNLTPEIAAVSTVMVVLSLTLMAAIAAGRRVLFGGNRRNGHSVFR
jgi:mannopine transport system permease protein